MFVRCAACVAGCCAHEGCRGNLAMAAHTMLAGTALCADCLRSGAYRGLEYPARQKP